MRRTRRWPAAALAPVLVPILAVALCFPAGPARADDGPLSRRNVGCAGLGAAALLYAEAYSAHGEAGDYRDARDLETEPVRRMQLGDEVTRYDRRRTVMLVLGTGALAWSVRHLRGEDEEELPWPAARRPALTVAGMEVAVTGDLRSQTVALEVCRRVDLPRCLGGS